MSDKIIRDNVHGYIAIPDEYMKRFIDTQVFQRLRNIEQTSMRCLFPCARHDRFAHSIGTFHIGRQLIQSLINNLERDNNALYNIFKREEWEAIRKTFEIACLLHDCAHAPYSHITEKYMDYKINESGKAVPGLLIGQLIEALDQEDTDFSNRTDLESCAAANHEYASALLLWKKYKDDIRELGADPLLAMRMILRYKFTPANTIEKQMYNCIITLLNGTHIDADKLDYIIRDTVSSGVDNLSVDLYRLINAVTIIELDNHIFTIGYLKRSISIIQNIIIAKNNLYLWIYAHHKVQYHTRLLCICFEKAIEIIFAVSKKDDILYIASQILSVNCILSPTAVGTNNRMEVFYLVCDTDIYSLIKKAFALSPDEQCFKELFSRVYRNSLWKSYFEFKKHFKISEESTATLVKIMESESKSSKIIKSICKALTDSGRPSKPEDWTVIPAKAKLSKIVDADIYIDYGDQKLDYTQVAGYMNKSIPEFFYMYYDGTPLDNNQIGIVIKTIQSYV